MPGSDVTLLLPVYAADVPAQLRDAFESSVTAQSRRPDAVLVVVDGPIDRELDAALGELLDSSPVPTRALRLPRNRGLAAALNAGLAEIETEYVARMDADDVSHPDRLARQMAEVEARALDLLGTGLAEFLATTDEVLAVRVPPSGDRILRAARWAQPFNHPTVVYRRSAVLAVGGYPGDVGRMEDYVLFARLLLAGVRADNLPEPLLYYRVGAGAYARRGGMGQLRAELALQRELRRIGLTSRGESIRNVLLRGGYRLAPTWLRRLAYRRAATERTAVEGS